jgi:simple sugar transport system permease protein
MKKMLNRFMVAIKPSLIAILFGLFVGLIIMLAFNPLEAFPALFTLLMGGFNGGLRGIGNTLYMAAPIILSGLAVAFAFKTGLFNIGASGQMMVGAYVAVHIGVLWKVPGLLHWVVALCLGGVAGLIWGIIPGLLKAFRNVNEVISSIMMNYIASFLLIMLINRNVIQELRAEARIVQRSATLPSLEFLFPRSTINIGIIIAIVVVIIVHIIIHKTTLGFQLRASGFSMDGSKYAGMNTKRNIVIAMALSGLFAGLGGAISFLTFGKALPADGVIFSEGFDGISVALLGLGEPLGALFAGLFLSSIRMGGYYLQGFVFVPQIVDMIVAIIIYMTAISIAVQALFKRYGEQLKAWWNNRKKKGDEA